MEDSWVIGGFRGGGGAGGPDSSLAHIKKKFSKKFQKLAKSEKSGNNRNFFLLYKWCILPFKHLSNGIFFRLMDCEKKSLKIYFSSAFLHSFRISTSFFGKMKSNIGMSIHSYLFPMCLLRKQFCFFPILQLYLRVY